jgi:hypothetical protein
MLNDLSVGDEVTSDQIIFWFSKKNNTNNTNINDYD